MPCSQVIIGRIGTVWAWRAFGRRSSDLTHSIGPRLIRLWGKISRPASMQFFDAPKFILSAKVRSGVKEKGQNRRANGGGEHVDAQADVHGSPGTSDNGGGVRTRCGIRSGAHGFNGRPRPRSLHEL